jgi:hypothetical protein
VVLVGHDTVEADLIGESILFVILVIQDMGLLWIEVGVRKAQTPGIVLGQIRIGDVAIGLLREPEHFYAVFHSYLPSCLALSACGLVP